MPFIPYAAGQKGYLIAIRTLVLKVDHPFMPLHEPVPNCPRLVEIQRIHADEENLLQVVKPNSQEAIVSCLSLHWINDLPGSSSLRRR